MNRPPEVSEFAWQQLSDRQRKELLEHLAAVWYNKVGQYMTDEEWLRMLMG
jgi:hypothetical protein